MVLLLKIAAEALVRDLGGGYFAEHQTRKNNPPQIPDHYSAAIWYDKKGFKKYVHGAYVKALLE